MDIIVVTITSVTMRVISCLPNANGGIEFAVQIKSRLENNNTCIRKALFDKLEKRQKKYSQLNTKKVEFAEWIKSKVWLSNNTTTGNF